MRLLVGGACSTVMELPSASSSVAVHAAAVALLPSRCAGAALATVASVRAPSCCMAGAHGASVPWAAPAAPYILSSKSMLTSAKGLGPVEEAAGRPPTCTQGVRDDAAPH